jgi:hypothetical protein
LQHPGAIAKTGLLWIRIMCWWVQATFQCDDDDVHFMASTSYISMWWWWCPLCTRSTCILIWNFIMKWTSSSSHWNVACTHHEVDIMTLKCSLYSPWSGHHHHIEMTSYISMWWWWCPLHGEYKLHFSVMMMMSTSWWVPATFQCDDVHFMVSTSYISMW